MMTKTQAAQWLSDNNNILILTHCRPDGDTLCTAAGLRNELVLHGKTVWLLPNPEATERYISWMGDCWAPEGWQPEHVMSVDTAAENMFQINAACYEGRVELSIDHHGTNSCYAENYYIEPERASCGEIVLSILEEMYGGVSRETAKLIYIALSTDCGCFVYGNTDSNAHEAAARLAKYGAPLQEINKYFFRTKTRKRIAFESRILGSLEYSRNGAVAVAKIPMSLMNELEIDDNDTDDIAALPGQIEGVVVAITIKERPGGEIKASVRTTPLVDASLICREFGGGGHKMAAGCSSMEYDIDQFADCLRAAADRVWPQE